MRAVLRAIPIALILTAACLPAAVHAQQPTEAGAPGSPAGSPAGPPAISEIQVVRSLAGSNHSNRE